MEKVNKSSGGVLQKSVSRPKNTNESKDRAFLESMDSREKRLKEIYDDLSKNRDGEAFVAKVK